MKYFSVKESADYLGISRQMLYILIKSKKIDPIKFGCKSRFTKEMLDNYYDTRWSRKRHFSEDEVGVKGAAEILHISPLQFYYIIYRGRIPFRRVGSLYIMKKQDVFECSKNIIKCQSKSSPRATIKSTGQKSINARKRFKPLFTTLPKEAASNPHAP